MKQPIEQVVWNDERIIAEVEAVAASWHRVLDREQISLLRGQILGLLRQPRETIAALEQRLRAQRREPPGRGAQPYPVEVLPPQHVIEGIMLDMEGDYSLDSLRYVVYNDAGRDEWLEQQEERAR